MVPSSLGKGSEERGEIKIESRKFVYKLLPISLDMRYDRSIQAQMRRSNVIKLNTLPFLDCLFEFAKIGATTCDFSSADVLKVVGIDYRHVIAR